MSVHESFQRLETWLEQNAKPLLENFNSPATNDQIEDVEKQLGVTIPASVRAAYLRNNGETTASDGIFGTCRWLPLHDIVDRHEMHREIEEEHKFGDFKLNFMIPIIESGGGDFYYVESVSAQQEDSEVIEWWHERPTRDVQAPNFAAFLSSFVDDVYSGKYIFDPDELNALIDKDDL